MTQQALEPVSELPANGMQSFLELIDKVVAAPELDADKLEKLLNMQERIVDRQARQEFNRAMVDAQKDMPVVVADKVNPHTRSRYPSLENVQTSIKDVALTNGFTVTFAEDLPVDGRLHVVGIVRHVSGHTETFNRYAEPDTKGPSGTPNKTDVQGSQATVTYLSRRLLCAIFNITVKDDDKDGNATTYEKVSEDQAATLKALAEEVKADVPKFCKYFRIDAIENLPASQYKSAVKALEKKRKAA